MKSYYQKLIIIGSIICLLLPVISHAQVRCFEFGLNVGASDWRDSVCVACTSDSSVLADVDAQLALPVAIRDRHINGKIAGGYAGVNQNGPHKFLWHFIPGEWAVREFSMEVCDGRPYTDVDADTLYWIHTVESFCPWTSYVKREIGTVSIPVQDRPAFAFYPNPATSVVNFVAMRPCNGELKIADMAGRVVFVEKLVLSQGAVKSVEVSHLPPGIYAVSVIMQEFSFHTKLNKN